MSLRKGDFVYSFTGSLCVSLTTCYFHLLYQSSNSSAPLSGAAKISCVLAITETALRLFSFICRKNQLEVYSLHVITKTCFTFHSQSLGFSVTMQHFVSTRFLFSDFWICYQLISNNSRFVRDKSLNLYCKGMNVRIHSKNWEKNK